MKNTYLHKINNWFIDIYKKENIAKLPSFSSKTIILTLSFIIAVFYFHFLLYANYYHNPHFDDYTYFYYVDKMYKAGGIADFIGNYIDGVMGYTWTSIFTLLLMPFYKHSYTFFSYGNYINLAFGILMIITVYHVGKKLFNSNFVGLTAALLISLNATILIQTSRLATENMLTLFATLSFLFVIRGFDNNKYWILAPLMGILAYASKANGLLVIVSPFITILFVWKRLKYKYTTLIITIALLFVSMFAFNTVIEGNNSLFLWKNVGVYDSDYHGYTSIERYHGIKEFLNDPKEVARRIVWGVTKQLDKYGTSLLVSIAFRYKELITISTGMLLFPFFLYLILIDQNWKRKYLFLIFSVILFISLIPRASTNHTAVRYSIMATPIFYFYLAPILYRFAIFIKRKWNISLKSLTLIAVAIAIITNSVIFFDSYYRFSLFPKFDKAYQQSLDWLKDNSKAGDIIAIESNSRLKFAWYTDYKIGQINSATSIKGKYIEDEKLIKYFKNNKVKYIIVDSNGKHTLTKENIYFFGKHIKNINNRLYVNKDTLPKELKIVFQDAEPAHRIIILELNVNKLLK